MDPTKIVGMHLSHQILRKLSINQAGLVTAVRQVSVPSLLTPTTPSSDFKIRPNSNK